MKMSTLFLFVLVYLLSAPVSFAQPPAIADSAIADSATAAVAAACAQQQVPFCATLGFERRQVTDDIAWYSFEVQVGAGEYDVIRLHRVVRERSAARPIRTRRAIFLAHGDRWGFEATYLSSLLTDEVDDEQNLAVFLARNDYDVWGMDFRWVLVGDEVEDVSFMTDWGLDTDAADLGLGLAAARTVRLVTGNGYHKLHLAGFSRGGHASYVYLGSESQLPWWRRHVKGFVVFDIGFKSDDPAVVAAACGRYESTLADFEAGETVASSTLFQFIADLALTAPEDPSPFFDLFTNRQIAIDVLAFGRPAGITPFFHAVAGIYDEEGFPQGLSHSTEDHAFNFLRAQAIHQPVKIFIQADEVLCGENDSPLDDHLADITVPVFYVGAEGGFGQFGIHTTTLLGSTDVSSLVVSFESPENRAADIGHQELFLADDAENLFWQPILDWLEDRRGRSGPSQAIC